MILHYLYRCDTGKYSAKCRTCDKYTGTVHSNKEIRNANCEDCFKKYGAGNASNQVWKQCRDCDSYSFVRLQNRAEIYRPAICSTCREAYENQKFSSYTYYELEILYGNLLKMVEVKRKKITCFGCNRVIPFRFCNDPSIPHYCSDYGTDDYKTHSEFCSHLQDWVKRKCGEHSNNLVLAGLCKQVFDIKHALKIRKEENARKRKATHNR